MSSRWGWRGSAVFVAVLTLFGVLIANPEPAAAATFTVNGVADTVDANPGDGSCDDGGGTCTLRAAIMEANASAGEDSITLPSGAFFLLIAGSDEDAGATGDLDITESVTITGTGASTTVIEAGVVDRLLHVHTGATVTLTNLTVSEGDLDQSTGASGRGGGILNEGSLTLDGVTISGNEVATSGRPGFGGGVASIGPIVVRDSIFSANAVSAAGDGALGGGLYHADSATITGTTFTANEVRGSLGIVPEEGARGGAIYSAGPLDFSDGTIDGNQAVDNIQNQARAYGGGIFAIADVTITASSVTSNFALATEGQFVTGSARARGGAIAISGVGSDLRLNQTTLSGNEVDIVEADPDPPLRGTGYGGAVFTEQVAKAHVVNSTLSGNTARTGGGAVYHTGSDASYSNATVALNVAGSGGGLAGSGTSTAVNSIFAGNTATAGPDCSGSIQSGGYNLLGDSAGCVLNEDPATSRIDVDPKLGPLADNGGATLTHAVLDNFSPAAGSASPATPGSGSGACETTDQRGVARPGGQRCDIGAYESPYLPAPPLSCNGLTATINGTPGDDNLIGTEGDDVIAGGDGNDTLVGNGGNDIICGGNGNDELSGGDGNDITVR